MNQALNASCYLAVPRLVPTDDGAATVTRWGRVLGQVLRPGDRVVLGAGVGSIVLLLPRGMGRPMLALRAGQRLLALPGQAPASPQRWNVAGTVAAIERDLERGAPGSTPMHVAVRVSHAAEGDHAGAAQLVGGWLDTASMDALCIRAAAAPRLWGARVAVAAAPTLEQARQLLMATADGCLRFVLTPPRADADQTHGCGGRVIDGPWPVPARSTTRDRASHRPGGRQVTLACCSDTAKRA
ncbi:MAG: hypothetical protein GXP62_08545 [Oligoflexia bacterium]|nr:hypothetical protein [Oligoflexia bacterium]